MQQILAGLELAFDFCRYLFAAIQPLGQALLAFAHGGFQSADGALGDFGGRDQF